MFDTFYHFNLVDKKHNPETDVICRWTFNFKAKVRRYVAIVELYKNHIYIVKYYAACHGRCKHKYSIVYNDESPGPIIRTCVNIMLQFYEENNWASFGFFGASSINKKRKGVPMPEGISNTQRFRIYKIVMYNLFGKNTFAHAYNKKYSAYLMINRKNRIIKLFKREAEIMFSKLYVELNFHNI